MKLIVQKFGGSSVRDAQRIRNVAGIIADTYRAGNQVLVVLSAQGDTTDDLIEKAKEINPRASKREMDMLLSTGEQISIALCAMALEKIGVPAVSLAAWQVGIQSNSVHSDARIKRIDEERIRGELNQRKVVLVAGFQNYKIFMPPLCGIFFLPGGGRIGCNTFDRAAQKQGQVGCGLSEKPHRLCAESR